MKQEEEKKEDSFRIVGVEQKKKEDDNGFKIVGLNVVDDDYRNSNDQKKVMEDAKRLVQKLRVINKKMPNIKEDPSKDPGEQPPRKDNKNGNEAKTRKKEPSSDDESEPLEELGLDIAMCWWNQTEALQMFREFHECLRANGEKRPITSVKVSYINDFGVDALKVLLLPWVSSLKVLQLFELQDEDLDGLQDVILQCNNLQELTIGSCRFLTSASIPILTKVINPFPLPPHKHKLRKFTLNDNQEMFRHIIGGGKGKGNKNKDKDNKEETILKPFASALSISNLSHVEFKRCRLSGKTVDIVLDGLSASKNLQELSIVTESFQAEPRNYWNDTWTTNMLHNFHLEKINIDTCGDLQVPTEILGLHCNQNIQRRKKKEEQAKAKAKKLQEMLALEDSTTTDSYTLGGWFGSCSCFEPAVEMRTSRSESLYSV